MVIKTCLLAAGPFDYIQNLPTFGELVKYYGPWLTLIVVLVVGTLFLQYRWFKTVIKAKESEIIRLAERERELNERVLHMIDEEIGFKKKTVKR